MAVVVEYTHQELGQEVHFLPGYYVPLEELRLKYNGREVLYIVGKATVESSCCGTGSCGYALVAGYLLSWKSRANESGQPISEVEPIRDQETKRDITRIIREREGFSNISFW